MTRRGEDKHPLMGQSLLAKHDTWLTSSDNNFGPLPGGALGHRGIFTHLTGK